MIALFIIIVAAIIGVLNTLYLSYHALTGADVACVFFPKEWCQKVQHSTYSKTFGIPNAFMGLVMYVAILVLALLFAQASWPMWWLFGVIVFGALFSLYFSFLQGMVIKAWCTWCVLSALDFLVLLAAVLYIVFTL